MVKEYFVYLPETIFCQVILLQDDTEKFTQEVSLIFEKNYFIMVAENWAACPILGHMAEN